MISSASHTEKRSPILLEKTCRPLRLLDANEVRSFSHPKDCCRGRSVDILLTVAETIGLLILAKELVASLAMFVFPYSCRLCDKANFAGSSLGRAEVGPPRWSILIAPAVSSTNVIHASKR